jgi:hypothetical protein
VKRRVYEAGLDVRLGGAINGFWMQDRHRRNFVILITAANAIAA